MSDYHDLPPAAFDSAVAIIVFCLGVLGIACYKVPPEPTGSQFIFPLADHPTPRPRLWRVPETTGEEKMLAALDNRYYFAVRDSTRALIRRKYKGDTTTARAQAYFRHMDSAYNPTYLLP